MMTIFKRCKTVRAAEIARAVSIDVIQKGNREWSHCPFHEDNTPSLLFNQNGTWHCFSCKRGGDAVSFYAELYQLTIFEAANEIIQMFGLQTLSLPSIAPAPVSLAKQLMIKVEGWHRSEWHRACKIKHMSAALISAANQECDECAKYNTPFIIPPLFFKWVAANAFAECRLEVLQMADVHDKITIMMEESYELTQVS